jgi:dUTP pyrophosphatase
VIGTGIKMIPPTGAYIHLLPRSGLAAKFSIDIGAGIIDPDYTGELKVCLINNGLLPFRVNKGDRIA